MRLRSFVAPLLLACLASLLFAGCGEEEAGEETSGHASSSQEKKREEARLAQAKAREQARLKAKEARRQQRLEVQKLRAEEAREAAESEAIAAEEEAAAESCDPNYSGCLNPSASDYDCEGGSGDGPEYTGTVSVVGEDHFGLDSDSDGVGCEAE